MMYGFCYKQGSLSYDRVKSLVNAIDFELPRNWDCSGEMDRKADEIAAFMQSKVAYTHLGVMGIFKSYTPHMATMMLDVTWYCAVSAYHKPAKNVHCVARMGTEYGAPFAVGIGTSLAASRKPAQMESFLNACWELGASVPESAVEFMSDLAVAMVVARRQALKGTHVSGRLSEMPDMFIASGTTS